MWITFEWICAKETRLFSSFLVNRRHKGEFWNVTEILLPLFWANHKSHCIKIYALGLAHEENAVWISRIVRQTLVNPMLFAAPNLLSQTDLNAALFGAWVGRRLEQALHNTTTTNYGHSYKSDKLYFVAIDLRVIIAIWRAARRIYFLSTTRRATKHSFQMTQALVRLVVEGGRVKIPNILFSNPANTWLLHVLLI